MEVGLEEERLQQEAELNQKDNKEEVQQHTERSVVCTEIETLSLQRRQELFQVHPK